MTTGGAVPRTPEPPEPDEPVTGEDSAAAIAVDPALTATSLGDYLRGQWVRIRGGETGALPVVAGLVLIGGIFQYLNSNFLTAGNLVNLLVQGSVFMLLAMGEVYVLLLGEIDLSLGYVAGLGGVVMAELIAPKHGWPWWAGVLAGLLVCVAIGLLQGTLITRIGLPSFVVTLAGQLAWLGVLLHILGSGGVIPVDDETINNIASGQLSPTVSWIVMLAVVGAYAVWSWYRDERRRSSGLVAPPRSVTLIKSALTLAAGIAVVLICNTDRGVLIPIRGVPWVLLVVLAVLLAWTVVLARTRFGRFVYAIGGSPEAARRAGVNLAVIRTTAFALGAFTAGIAGIVYASRLRSVSTSFDGATLVLYAVAAAVIGGTSLFGGRGRPLSAVLGGLVIAAIDNGMGLQGYSAPSKFIVTAIVLVLAVTIDALARRGRAAVTR